MEMFAHSLRFRARLSLSLSPFKTRSVETPSPTQSHGDVYRTPTVRCSALNTGASFCDVLSCDSATGHFPCSKAKLCFTCNAVNH